MPDSKKQERRRWELKLREAAERRDEQREKAGWLCAHASRSLRGGDAPAAARLARKALALDPSHAEARDLLGHVYFEARRYDVALPFLKQMRKFRTALCGPSETAVSAVPGLLERVSGMRTRVLPGLSGEVQVRSSGVTY